MDGWFKSWAGAWLQEMQERSETVCLYFWCLSGGGWERSQQWTRQSDISVLRRRHAHAENVKRWNNKVCIRGEADETEQRKTSACTHLLIFVSLLLQNKNLPIENTTDCLSTMATVCKVMLETPWVTSCDVAAAAVLLFTPECLILASCVFREYRSRFTSEETVSFCLRVMVGVIILYDYVHPVGAFAKSSKIDVSRATLAFVSPCL